MADLSLLHILHDVYINIYTYLFSNTVLLTSEQIGKIKNQSFVRHERVKEMLESTQSILIQRVPDWKASMKVFYIS